MNLAEAIAQSLKKSFWVTLHGVSQSELQMIIEDTMKRELELSDPMYKTTFGLIAGGRRDGI